MQNLIIQTYQPIKLAYMDIAWNGEEGIKNTVILIVKNAVIPAIILILAVLLIVQISRAVMAWRDGRRLPIRQIVITAVCLIIMSTISFSGLVSRLLGNYSDTNVSNNPNQGQVQQQ